MPKYRVIQFNSPPAGSIGRADDGDLVFEESVPMQQVRLLEVVANDENGVKDFLESIYEKIGKPGSHLLLLPTLSVLSVVYKGEVMKMFSSEPGNCAVVDLDKLSPKKAEELYNRICKEGIENHNEMEFKVVDP